MGLGCMGMSEYYGQTSQPESLETIARAIDLGVTMFDTADVYGRGANEELLGLAMAGKRDRVQIATKFGVVRDSADRRFDGRPDYVRSACEASLRRLKVDHIDLYYLHRVDPATPIEDTVGAMGELVAAGKVNHIGLSEVTSQQLRQAAQVHPIAAVQSEWSLWCRRVEFDLVQTCRALGTGIVPYSPLGRGFLTGGIRSTAELSADDFRRTQPQFAAENIGLHQRRVELLSAVGDELGYTPGQVALAWLLGKGQDVVPIPGTKRVSYLEQNLAALDVQLSSDHLARIEEIFPPGPDETSA